MSGGKKGGLHTIEAVLGFFMVLSFIIFVMPYLKNDESISRLHRYVYESAISLEKTGKLNDLVIAGNTSEIAAEMRKNMVLPINFTVTVSALSIDTGIVSPKENRSSAGYINFSINSSTIESAKVGLEYLSAADPLVEVNGNEAASHAGDFSGKRETINLLSYLTAGQNSIRITASNNATIDYRLWTVNADEPDVPSDRSITSVSYIISGNRTAFGPRELRVYVWK